MAGNSLGRAVVEFGASTASLQTDANRAVGIVDKAVADINVSLNRAGSAANFSGISSQVNSLKADFASLQGVIGGVFGVTLGAGMLRQIGAMADEWQNANNRIQTTVSSSEQLLSVQRDVFSIAQQTGSAFDDSAKMYQRLEQSIQSSGKSQADAQREALALTKTLNQEIVVSGASAGEASRSIMDLVHGLSGGVLHAQQLRPIMRQMPDLAKQIADGLGVSAAQFEEMVHKGLPAEAVLKALEERASSIETRFTALPKTFAQTWQYLENAVERYVGETTRASAASDLTKAAIKGVADNIDTIATGAETAGIAMAAWLGGKALNAFSGLSTSIKDAVIAQGAYKTAAMVSAEADIAGAAATAKAAEATLLQTERINDQRIAKAQQAELKIASLRAEEAALLKLQASNLLFADEQKRLGAVQAQLTKETAALASMQDKMAASQAKAAMAEVALTEAQTVGAAATQRLTLAKTEATTAIGLMSRAGSGLLTLMGGWPGVLLAAGAALVYFTGKSDAASQEIENLKKQADELSEKNATFAQAMFAMANGINVTTMSVREKTQADAAMLESLIKNATWFDQVTGKLGDYQAALGIARKKIAELDEAQAAVDFQKFVGKVECAAQSIRDMFGGSKAKFDIELTSKNDELTKRVEKETEAEAKRVATFGLGRAATVAWEREQALAAATAHLSGKALEDETKFVYDLYDMKITLAQAEDADIAAKKAGTAATKEQAKAIRDAAKEVRRLAKDELSAQQFLERLNGKLGGPYQKAWSDYASALLEADKMGEKFKADGMSVGKVQQFIADATAAATEHLREQTDAESIIARIIGDANRELDEHARLYGLSADEIKSNEIYTRLLEAANRDLGAIMGPLTEKQQNELDSLKAISKQIVEADKATEKFAEQQRQAQQVAQDYANIWTSTGNSLASTFGKVLVEGGSLFNSLKDIAKQTVEQIIEYFAKLAVINPILNSIFGGSIVAGGGSLLPTLANAAVGGGSSGLSASGLLGGAANFTSTASGGTQFSIMSPSSWISAGKSLWTGFSSSAAAPGSSMFGTWSGNGSVFGAGVDPYYTGGGTYTPSALGTGLAVAGGIYAGYNRFQGSNKDVGGALGGVAYGIGTYSAAIGAGAALSGGLAAGFAAIPIVGWIALAAMAIDMISGGKLFGTAGKVIGGRTELEVGASGAALSQYYTTKGQNAFFGGAYWKDHAMNPGQQAIDAAHAFFDAVKKGTDTFAAEFKLQTSKMVDGKFVVDFDKKGNQTGTTSTINGLTYKGETQEQFAERLTAESGILTLKQLGLDVTKYTNQFISDADNYAKVVQDVGNAMAYAYQDITRNKLDISGGKGLQGAYDMTLKYQSGSDSMTDTYGRLQQEAIDIANGVKLLTGQDTIASIEAFLRETSKVGESLSQTYQRLQQAGQQYTQFIAQFAPQATYVDDFEASLSNLRKSEQDAIKQANDLAKAAGLEGANTQDLVKIHQSAAKQFADLVKQLQESAQSLAFNLGLSNTGTLDQVNAEIDRLQGLAGNASSSVSSFGDAMQSASQKATDAINLLLGNLSPLNDQEKLQKALQAQMHGLVAPDAVLEIGRRLYASSSAYNQLFAQVQAIGDRTNKGGSSYSGSGSSSTTFTSADQDRLTALLAEQKQLEKVAQLQQYQTLAQQIAEIASAKGEDYMQVISDMGIDLKDFEKGLGIANDDALKTYIDNIQAQKDSEGQNTASIVDAINHVADLLQRVLDAPKSPVGGPGNGGVVTVGDDGSTGRSTTSHGGGRNITDGDAEAIGNALYNAIQRPSGGGYRPAPGRVAP